MAARRVRIKGIANIPQRRKPLNVTHEIEPESQKEHDGNKCKEVPDNPNLCVASDTHDNNVINRGNEEIPTLNIEERNVSVNVTNNLEELPSKHAASKPDVLSTQPASFITDIKQETNETESKTADSTDINNTAENKVPMIRRKFLKPPICINVLNRKPKEKLEQVAPQPNETNVQENFNVVFNEIEFSATNRTSSVTIQKHEPLMALPVLKLETSAASVKDSIKSGSDTEYQQPPASPTKILNRRIKAVPKLHHRRTSFSIGSASESEDDTRRSYSRIRNDSVCSTNSGVNESHPANEAASPSKKEFTVVQRKSRRTEQTRKIAEARREFNMKFNNGKPDKQKLTMIDLIFYNPATSPMSHNKRKRKNTSTSDVSDTKSIEGEKLDEEKADDPLPQSESDSDVPAPQIKVGPNGEIIVDEKSLVIENSEVIKGREALQMSEIVNGDDDTSYGVFKRVKRSKEWTKEETLRFYKALNTIGTDFTMMCELFPNRTRRELKMKFKKEERLNQNLINKAVMQPIEFDMTELRRDLELAERKAAESKKRAQEKKTAKATIMEQRKNPKQCERIKGIDTNLEYFTTTEVKKAQPVKKQKKTAYDTIRRGIDSILSDSDEDGDLDTSTSPRNKDDSDEDAEETETVANILKPTRYGRIPKARAQDAFESDNKHKEKKRKADAGTANDDQNQGNLEPGSIMVVKSKTPVDKVVYKVYIVTDKQTKQQINFAPDMLQNLAEMGVAGSEDQDNLSDVQAHNILTISAQECPNIADLNVENISDANGLTKRHTSDKPLHPEIQMAHDSSKPPNNSNNVEILRNSLMYPFNECLTPTPGHQNVTVSHDDNKMIVVTENNKECV